MKNCFRKANFKTKTSEKRINQSLTISGVLNSRQHTVMSFHEKSQTFKQIRSDISTVSLTLLLIKNPKHCKSTSRADRVPTKGIKLNLLGHHTCNFWSCNYSSQWQTIANTLIQINTRYDEIAAEDMKVKKLEQNNFHNEIWQKKIHFNENIPKIKYLKLKI